ncbi:transmembrane protein 145-like isoform X2 [Tachypleus tridentatus]|uniref:transmembrane protein 145-like isoform X2 n=1 Tax=Tachypleus tridentatus TaxID=6853 RepID=UPI003FD63A69
MQKAKLCRVKCIRQRTGYSSRDFVSCLNTGGFRTTWSIPRQDYEIQNILLYFDSSRQWPSVYKTDKTCLEKEAVLSVSRGQVINLTSTSPGSGCEIEVSPSGKSMYHCSRYRIFESVRPRWWFIAVSNCNSSKGVKLKYHFVMTNDEKNYWFKHFSADEFYILQTDVTFATLYCLLILASCFEAHTLHARHLLHVTYKLYMASLIFECAGISCLCIFYGVFAHDGIGLPVFKLLGRLLEAISTMVFLLLLILISKGYTVTRGRLKPLTSAKIGVFMTVYTVVYSTLFIYEKKVFDPGEVLYVYDSPAGYGLVGMRLVGWSWFVYANIFTLIHYPEKSRFYTKLFLIYSLWFLSGPVIILISTFMVPKWMREKLINGIELFISLTAHLTFFILTRPSAANKNFPFHVRTTQIDIMQQSTNGFVGDNNIDRFSHHPYALSIPVSHRPDYNSLFGVQSRASGMELACRPTALPSAPVEEDTNNNSGFHIRRSLPTDQQ